MANLDLREIHDFAVDLAKKAGEMILKASNSRLSSIASTVSEKKNCTPQISESQLIVLATDLVTETDNAVEEMVKSAIANKYRDHKYISHFSINQH
jgi:myo-inositol-1(or 4)-monophosphatase